MGNIATETESMEEKGQPVSPAQIPGKSRLQAQ